MTAMNTNDAVHTFDMGSRKFFSMLYSEKKLFGYDYEVWHTYETTGTGAELFCSSEVPKNLTDAASMIRIERDIAHHIDRANVLAA